MSAFVSGELDDQPCSREIRRCVRPTGSLPVTGPALDGRTEGNVGSRALPWAVFALILAATAGAYLIRVNGINDERALVRELRTSAFVSEVDDVRTRLDLEQQKLSFLVEGPAAAISDGTSADDLASTVAMLPIGERVPAIDIVAIVERSPEGPRIIAAVDKSGVPAPGNEGHLFAADSAIALAIAESLSFGEVRIAAVEIDGRGLFGLTMAAPRTANRSILITFSDSVFLTPALGDVGVVTSVLVPPPPSAPISAMPFDDLRGEPTEAGSVEVIGDEVVWCGFVDVFGSRWGLFTHSSDGYLSVPASNEQTLIGLLGLTLAFGTLLLLRHRQRRLQATADVAATIEQSNRRFSTGFDNAPIGMAILDTEGSFVRCNATYAAQLGCHPGDLAGHTHRRFVFADDLERQQEQFQKLSVGVVSSIQLEYRYMLPNGNVMFVSESVSALNRHTDPERQFLVQTADHTERRAAEDELRYQARHDHLTGLPNRTMLLEVIAEYLERSREDEDDVALMFVDLDQFKVVNDSLGHGAGDEVIQILADRLRVAVGIEHFISRFGGDEFVIVCFGDLEDVDLDATSKLVRQQISRRIELEGSPVNVTASVGVTVAEGPDDTPESLIRDGDAAMYRAKSQGRDRTEHFEADIRSAAVSRLDLEQRLREAIDLDAFDAHYQPVVDLTTGKIVAFEALLRWDHPDLGSLLPAEFLGVADEAGLIDNIDRLTLSRACLQFAKWSEMSEMAAEWHLSVNCSSRWLHDGVIAETLPALITDSTLDPSRLWLEVTESALLQDTGVVATSLDSLHELGVKVAIDDFGTGFSSLSYLSRFNVDRLKIDQSFVQSLGSSDADNAIVSAVVEMASALGLSSVAEGTESQEQLRILRELGADLAQGFVLSKPLSSSEIETALVTQS